jgi:hypothetical protein
LLRLLPTDDGQPYVKPYNSRLLDSDVFANTPVLEFYLPKYMDTIIEVSSAAKGDGSAPETSVHLAITQPLSRPPASAGGNKQSSAHGISQPMLVASNSNADPNADPNRSLLDAMKTAQLTLDHPSWNDGTNPSTSPPHQIRLVHAVKQPRQPTVTGLALARRYGETIANVGGTLKPHVASTGKVTFHASYDLVIDNPARPKPYSAHYKEVAFEVNLPTARPGQTGLPQG